MITVHLQSCDFYKILKQMIAKVTLWLFKALFYSALGCAVPRLFPCLDSISCKQTRRGMPQAMQRPSLQQSGTSRAFRGKTGPGTGYTSMAGSWVDKAMRIWEGEGIGVSIPYAMQNRNKEQFSGAELVE